MNIQLVPHSEFVKQYLKAKEYDDTVWPQLRISEWLEEHFLVDDEGCHWLER